MPAPAWENLDDFLDVDDFATPATITFGNGSSQTASVIYDDPYLNAQLGEFEPESTSPRITGKWGDLRLVVRGTQVAVGGEIYDAVRGVEPDGTGMATVYLARRNDPL